MKLTKVRKLLAFTLAAGLLLSSATAFAAPYHGKDGVTMGEVESSSNKDHYYGPEPPDITTSIESWWTDTSGTTYKWDRASSKWVLISGSSGSSHKTAEEKEAQERKRAEEAAEREAQERAYQEAIAQKREAEEGGFGNVDNMLDADSQDMSSEEWNNNAVINTPGMDLSLPVSAGQGSVVIDGEKTNITPAIEKADAAFVDSINREKDGVLLNVLQVSYPSTDDAEITFDLPGMNADSKIAVYQYNNGVWTEVEVTEVRDGHMTLHMQGDGVVAFMLEPVEQATAAQSGISDLLPYGKEMLGASEIISSVVIIEEQPVVEKIIHWNCVCGFDTTDKDAFKQHALEGVRRGEQHNYHNWTEEVEVYE